MVDLDNLEVLQVDRSAMLELLLDLAAQLQVGERLGQNADLPLATDVHAVVVTGLGGSGISGDYAALIPTCGMPCADPGQPALWPAGVRRVRDAGLCGKLLRQYGGDAERCW